MSAPHPITSPGKARKRGGFLHRFWPLAIIPALGAGWLVGQGLPERAPVPRESLVIFENSDLAWQLKPSSGEGYARGNKDVKITRGPTYATIRSDASKVGVQIMSDPIEVLPGRRYRLTWGIEPVENQMKVSIVDAIAKKTIAQAAVGPRPVTIDFQAPSQRVRVMLLNANGEAKVSLVRLGAARLQ